MCNVLWLFSVLSNLYILHSCAGQLKTGWSVCQENAFKGRGVHVHDKQRIYINYRSRYESETLRHVMMIILISPAAAAASAATTTAAAAKGSCSRGSTTIPGSKKKLDSRQEMVQYLSSIGERTNAVAVVSSCDGRTKKRPAAGLVWWLWQLCSIKWFIGARQKEVQHRGREGERERQPASITQLTLSWLCSRAHTSTRPLSLSLSLSLSLLLSHTHTLTRTHLLSHTDTGMQECRGSAVRSSTEQRSLSRMSFVFLNQNWSFSFLFLAVTDNPVNKAFQPRAPPHRLLT